MSPAEGSPGSRPFASTLLSLDREANAFRKAHARGARDGAEQAFYCEPTGGRRSDSNQSGALVMDSDPAVKAGIDTGCTPQPNVLRAPDIAVGMCRTARLGTLGCESRSARPRHALQFRPWRDGFSARLDNRDGRP